MLSIGAMGKAGGGAGDYYTNLAREDYYTQGGEPPGKWRGQAAALLGLEGHIERQDLRSLLSGYHHSTEKALIQRAGPNHRAGWDLTFSAPKSVSILWSQSDQTTRATIQTAQQTAVDKTLTFIQEQAAFTRRGHGGVEQEPVKGLIVAVFEHSTSREQDPQLHTHCLVANVAPRLDGSWGSLESRHFYQWQMAAGAYYRAELAQQLQNQLHVEIERDERSFRLSGMPRNIDRHFSKRTQQIEEKLSHFAVHSAAAIKVAMLSSREKKDLINRAELFDRWQQEGKELGFGPAEVHRLLEAPVYDRMPTPLEPERILQTLTQTASTFTERDLWRAAAESAQGITGAEGVKMLVEQTWPHSELVRLGRDVYGVERYSTRAMVKLEKDMVKQALERQQEGKHYVPTQTLQAVLEKRTLSPEQTTMVQHLTQGDAGVACVVGMAGTGKSYALAAAREAWEQAGFQVTGAALAGKAAQGLQASSQIPSSTLYAMLGRLDNGEITLTSRAVLVIDEAGMIGSRQLKQLLDYAKEAGAKVALIGDHRQLQPIDAGGAFRVLKDRLGAPALTDIRRQREDWARETVHQFAAGKSAQALANYHNRGLLTVAEDRAAALNQMTQDWIQDRIQNPEKSALLLTDTRQECQQLNAAARNLLKEQGSLGKDAVAITTTTGIHEFAVGDRILFGRNSVQFGVSNGSLGTIERIGLNRQEKPSLHIRLDDRRIVDIPAEQYKQIDYGYAITTHKAQGVTVDRAYVLTGGPMTDRELTYVQMSRHRDNAQIYVDRDTADELLPTPEKRIEELARTLSRSHQKDSTQDYEAKMEAEIDGMDRDLSLEIPPSGRVQNRDVDYDFGL